MNILTFDIEEWYVEFFWGKGRSSKYQLYNEVLSLILRELDMLGIKATFFCVGQLGKEFPEVVKSIVSKGHEIGCHSNIHTWLDKMTPEELYQDTEEALKVLEDVSGQKVVSYRAPAFSITPKNKWAVNILAECGIKNDSSIFPTDRDFGGYKGFPQDTPCIICHEGAVLKEFPISLTSIMGKRMAYSGGGYFRLLPYWIILKTMKLRDYNICYFHLNDLISQNSRLMSKQEYEEYFKELGTLKNRLIRFAKSNICVGDVNSKFMRVLSDFKYIGIRDSQEFMDWNKAKIIKL